MLIFLFVRQCYCRVFVLFFTTDLEVIISAFLVSLHIQVHLKKIEYHEKVQYFLHTFTV